MNKNHYGMAAVFSLLLLSVYAVGAMVAEIPLPQTRELAAQEFKDGNFKDAYARYRKLALNEATDDARVGNDLELALQCLQRLGRVNETDQLLEDSIETHQQNWRLLRTAARLYLQGVQHHGFIISGEFERGPHRGGGQQANSVERDRVRALQLMYQAMQLTKHEADKNQVAGFYLTFANQLLSYRGYQESWRFQYLTDLEELPDYEESYYTYRPYNGAPVDEEGQPVFHSSPESWQTAKNDGQRWRWCLDQVVEHSAGLKITVQLQRASFLHQQFGVQTIGAGFFHPMIGESLDAGEDGDEEIDEEIDESGVYDVHTLGENETIARLATGVKRFNLPDEFNFLKIYQEIAAEEKAHAENVLYQIADIFTNRRQFTKAADTWRENIERFGPGAHNVKKLQLQQIVDPWGRFEPVSTQPAGKGATVEYRFRNGRAVELTAQKINIEKLLQDLKKYLKSRPPNLDWQRLNIGNLGYRLIQQGQRQYVGEQVASWKVDLKPRKEHFDRRITLTSPLQKAGAYLVTAKMDDGNTSQIVLWVSDTAIVRKNLSGKSLYFIADARTGRPLPGVNLEFFGYRQLHIKNNRYEIRTLNFAEKTDSDGMVTPDPKDFVNHYQWITIARTKEGRLAFQGFHGAWSAPHQDYQYNQVKAFGITDRPVYRPKQNVKFKFWVARTQYDKDEKSKFANQSFAIQITNPKGEKVFGKSLESDEYGGVAGQFELPADATLGAYQLTIYKPSIVSGNISFRVEEYKKPEFEVIIDAPSEPVMLGEKVTAKVTAKYYFGSPVTDATVKLKVMRSEHTQNWYPAMPWDWCYGPGYWWFCYDSPWYPGWHKWVGCMRPYPVWWGWGVRNPPEVVLQREVKIGEDGTVEIEIDTALAKAMHGDQDHRYTITAEVRDQSRRTIVGQGKVLVARQPFKVFTWVDRGYYRVGDEVRASFKAQTLDNKPVQGRGKLTLLKITYDKDNQPVETPVRRWDVETDENGMAQQRLRASAKGQYRLSYKLTDSHNHTVEGGYLFTIIGDGFDGRDYRFNDLELIPDKADYKPGETVKLQINTSQVGQTVLLFVRGVNGVNQDPKILKIKGKSTIVEINVAKKDMPNFFVEAVTVADGKVHDEVKEIIVPPEKRVLNIEAVPSAKIYKPGEKAKLKLRLTDFYGEPFVGSTVVSVYDKSVEYISGGSNVSDIKEFFWKWRRQHRPQVEHNLSRYFGNVISPGLPGMGDLGVFGFYLNDVDKDMNGLRNETSRDRRFNENSSSQIMRGRAMGGLAGGGFAGRYRSAGNQMAFSKSAPMEGMQMDMAATMSELSDDAKYDSNGAADPDQLVQPTVRTNFADTALWIGALITDANGEAEVELEMPENLTTWKVKVWGMGRGARVGSGETEVITRKNLILRLQAPRFFVEKDEVVLSANVHNYLESDKEATVTLDLPGEFLQPLGNLTQKITIPAGSEHRIDWRVKVIAEGDAIVRMKALTDEESDAMQMTIPCYVHGMLKTESWAGVLRPDRSNASLLINVPAERRVEQSVLEIRYSPTLAGAMVDALPYLASYPYGCTEQTLNRFLPTVITQKTLLDMNLDLKAIRDKRTNLNAQEIGDDRERAKQWKRFDHNAVFDQAEVERMVKAGLKRLTQMQLSDGGWGWFSGYGEQSYPHTTAVVVHGLQVAEQNDVAIVPGVLQQGEQWLERYQKQQVLRLRNYPKKKSPNKQYAANLDAFIYMVLVDAGIDNEAMREFLYRDRTHLAVYSKAMFGLALEKQNRDEQLAMILRNIEQFVVEDEENETAYLQLPEGNYWWYWYGSEVEANAYYLKLLARTDAQGVRASRLVKYLLNNRKHSTYWNSTRDTALCVEAFAEFLKGSGEFQPNMVVEIWIDGEKRQEAAINGDNLFAFQNKFVLKGEAVTTGNHKIEIRRRGKGPVYYNAYLTNFTLEDHITRAGLEIKVNRKYYKLLPVDKTIKAEGSRGQVVDQKVEKYKRIELKELDTLKSGDLVEIELEIESKNDYEYILFEDMKAAGFEPVELRSGYGGRGLGAYMEMRDNRVAFFVARLMRGKHSIAYRMRAEIPGRFSALPTRASAMYAPELKANSDEIKLNIID